MKLSEARVLFLARESLAKLRDEGLAEISNFPLALRQAREIVAQFNEEGDAIDQIVRRKINSIKRGITEGSNEWTILYRRYRDEEMRKKGPQRSGRHPRDREWMTTNFASDRTHASAKSRSGSRTSIPTKSITLRAMAS